MKKKIRVVDIPTGVGAEELEALLNSICEDGYYSSKLVQTGLPEGIGMRAFFTLRANP
jgi:hypothetical protein